MSAPDRALIWALFLLAATLRPSKASVSDDAIVEDAGRADRMLEAYDRKFPSGRP